MKITICGPPHSGKSVFLGGLCANLPREARYLFRACPDGEGTWTWKGNGSENFRRKGTFSGEIVDWYVQSLRSCKMAPLILVDVGGRISDENRHIMSECDKAIILSGDLAAIEEWEKFCQDCGLEIIAVLHSDYHGTTDDPDSSPMVVHHLERGEDISSRPTIQRVAEMLLAEVETSTSATEAGKEGEEMEFLKGNILSVPALAAALGKQKVKRTLPNGRVVQQIVWEGSDLARVADLLHNHSAEMPEHVRINGAAPAWLVAALCHECHPRSVSLNSPDGYVAVGCRRPSGEGEGIDYEVETREDGWTVVTFTLNPSTPLSPEQLNEIAPPELPMGSKVIISGRGPNWLTASLVMAYHGRTKAVACFQPGSGATVCTTHSATVSLGEVIT